MFDNDDDNDTPNFFPENDGTEILGMTSIEDLQKYALHLFGKYLKRISGKELPPVPPAATERFLPLQELEAILRDHGREAEEGFAVGGSTIEEARKNINELMVALLSRILSNVLQQGVSDGLLECDFDTDTNDFTFGVTEKGVSLYGGKHSDETDSDNREGEGSDQGV